MKKINTLILLGLLSVSAGTMQAAVNAAPPATNATSAPADSTAAPTNAMPAAPADSTAASTNAMPAATDATPPPPATDSAPATISSPFSTPATPTEATRAFFAALVKCAPGHYQERNVLSATVGPDMLNHQINNLTKGICCVTLATPDGRGMSCNFNIDDLNALSEPHFISGILADTIDDPSDESVRADEVWGQLKSSACSF